MARKRNTPVDDEQNGSTRCVESVAAIGAVSSLGAPPDLSGSAPGRTALSDLARLLARLAARDLATGHGSAIASLDSDDPAPAEQSQTNPTTTLDRTDGDASEPRS